IPSIFPKGTFAAMSESCQTSVPVSLPGLHLEVEMPPRPAPSGPAPAQWIAREIVALFRSTTAKQEIGTGNLHHSLFVAVTLEQFLAETEEGGIWKAVILQDYRLLDVLKHPINAARDASATSHVRV